MTSDRVMYFRLTIRVSSTSKQARYYLGKENDEKNDHHRTPEQCDAQRAALFALIAPNVKLNEADAEQDCRYDEQPRTRRLQPDARSRKPQSTQKGKGQAASQSRERGDNGCHRRCSFCHSHGRYPTSEG